MDARKLDCTGLNCPMPIVAMSKAIKSMSSGELLEVSATDLAFKLDVEAWAKKTGNVLESFEIGPVQVAKIRVK